MTLVVPRILSMYVYTYNIFVESFSFCKYNQNLTCKFALEDVSLEKDICYLRKYYH